jgi:imidazolonepropionase-like amidohydrolase
LLINPQPKPINTITTVTFKITKILFKDADVPLINNRESKQMIKIEGKLIIPGFVSQGPCRMDCGMCTP